MKYISLCILLFLTSLCYAQEDKTALEEFIFPETNLKIKLPNYFETNNSINSFPGFSDPKNQITIIGAQATLELTIEESFQEQIESLNYNDAEIFEILHLLHKNDRAAMIEYEVYPDTLVSIIFIFGKKNAQNFISAQCPKSKIEETKNYILSVEKDSSILITNSNLIGFSAPDSSGQLKISAKNAAIITYEYRNAENLLKTDLKLVRLPIDRLKDVSMKEYAEYIEGKYFPYKLNIASGGIFSLEHKEVGYQKKLKSLTRDDTEETQYHSITILKFEKFYLLGIGSALKESALEDMDNIIFFVEPN